MRVDISSITIDPRLQSRAAMNDEAVQEYAEAILAGTKFDPVMCFEEGETLWLVEGFHRIRAHIAAGKTAIDIETKAGTFRDAWVHSLGTNDKHGVRRTNADKRKVVECALKDTELGAWSNGELAAHLTVSKSFVDKVRHELQPSIVDDVKPVSQESPKKEAAILPEPRTPEARLTAEAQPAGVEEPLTPKQEKEREAAQLAEDAMGDIDMVAELDRMAETIRQLEHANELLSKDDAKAELAKQIAITRDAEQRLGDQMRVNAADKAAADNLATFQGQVFRLTGTDSRKDALRVISEWKPK